MKRFGGAVIVLGCLTAALLAGFSARTAAGTPSPCPDPMFSVEAAGIAMTQRLCIMAAEIRGRLEGCGLRQTRALSIEVVDELSHPLGNCLAYFDCDFDLVRITNPDAYDVLMTEDQPYAVLPADVTLQALLTHELAHALVHQTAGDRLVPMVDQEYIAAAMELEHMDAAWRDVLLSRAPVDLPPKVGLIDIWIYGFAPRKFGVNAWQHFSLPESGCSLVEDIVSGAVSFSKDVRRELR